MALIVLSCAWIAGIAIGFSVGLPPGWLLAAPLPLALLFKYPARRKWIIIASLGLAAFFTGALLAQAGFHQTAPGQLDYYNGQSVLVRGIVAGDPEPGDRGTSFQITVNGINAGGVWQPVSGKMSVFSRALTDYNYGDELLITGKIESLAGDYGSYLANQGIYSAMYYPRIELTASGQGSWLLSRVYQLRDSMAHSIRRALPEPQAAVMEGMVLGRRAAIPDDLTADFSRSGTAHILAISGSNLTILAAILAGVGVWLFGRRHYYYVWLALAMVWAYTLFTGFNAPVVRAAIMVSVFLLAEFLGRQKRGFPALCLAAAIMVGLNPPVILEVSFQMSAAAMAGLVCFQPYLSGAGKKLAGPLTDEESPWRRPAGLVIDSLAASLAALIGVWPLIAWHFGIISLAGAPATLILLPVLPLIIIIGLAMGLMGLVFSPLAAVLGWVGWLFISYFILVARVAAGLPGAFITTGPLNPGLIWTYYAAGVVATLLAYYRKSVALFALNLKNLVKPGWKPQWILPPLAILAALSCAAAVSMPDNDLHVYFLDVGQGDAILLQKGSAQVLIDGGPGPDALMRELGGKMPFWDRNIELVVLTHPHLDHLGGLTEINRRFNLGQVISPVSDYDSRVYTDWLSALDAGGVKRTPAAEGQQIDLGGGAFIEVLHASSLVKTGTDADNDGTVLRLRIGDVSFLFTADISQSVEQELIEERPGLPSTVLKVAHHGSGGSTSTGFLAAVNPQSAVISVAAVNNYGLPASETLSRLNNRIGGDNIYRTDRQGTIEFITDGTRLTVRTGR